MRPISLINPGNLVLHLLKSSARRTARLSLVAVGQMLKNAPVLGIEEHDRKPIVV